ncbi:hypothetical protein [Methylobacterium brachiatum]
MQALADAVAADVRASGNYLGAQDFGNKVHARIAKIVNDQQDPNFFAEISYDLNKEERTYYSAKGSLRLDILEHSRLSTVCVYDHKTGQARLRAMRATDIASGVQKIYPGTLSYIMIEIRPK